MMATAAARLAARRLTGQQSQAILRSAVEREQGLINRIGSPAHALRRFTSSQTSAANAPKITTEHPSLPGDSRLMAADRKKEELADLLHEIQMNKEIPHVRRIRDRWLLHRLTDHVDPRPNNPKWRWYIREHKLNNFLLATSIFLGFLFMVEKWSSLGQYVHGRANSNSKTNAPCAE